jgi:hypothetical protein
LLQFSCGAFVLLLPPSFPFTFLLLLFSLFSFPL